MNMTMEKEAFHEPENSIGVLEFLRVAHEYCLFIEQAGDRERAEIYSFFQKLGPLIYLKGTLLPDISPDFPESAERFVTEEEWQEVFNFLRQRFLDDDEFYHVNYEEAIEYEAVKASLSENFSDIYQDLKDFVILYQKNTKDARQNAVFECKNLQTRRWGPKLLTNLRYIHFLIHRAEFSNPEYDL